MTWWWTSTLDGTLSFIAAGFGLGPRVAAENLARSLRLRIGPWLTRDSGGPGPATTILFNFGVVEASAESIRAETKVWVDCLMWLRESLPWPPATYNLIFSESFFDRDLTDLGSEAPIIDVRPLLVPLIKAQKQSNSIVISFGGIETPFTTDVHRFEIPHAILSALIRAGSRLKQDLHVACFTPPSTCMRLSAIPLLSGIDFRPLGRMDFLEALAAAKAYIVQPGLYGPFEAFSANIPTALCLPMSYTQMWQTATYMSNGLLMSRLYLTGLFQRLD